MRHRSGALAVGTLLAGILGAVAFDGVGAAASRNGPLPLKADISQPLPFRAINTPAKPFRTAVVEGRSGTSPKLLDLLVRGVPRHEYVTAACDTCSRYGDLVHGITLRKSPDTVAIRVNVQAKLTTHTRLVIAAFGGPISFPHFSPVRAGVGRYVVYGVRGVGRPLRRIASGCLAAGDAGPFLDRIHSIYGIASKPKRGAVHRFTPRYVASEGSVPCNVSVPTDRLALSPTPPTNGSPPTSTVTVSGYAARRGTLSFYGIALTPSDYRTCPTVPLLNSYRPIMTTAVRGRFLRAQRLNLPAAPSFGIYCGYLTTGAGTWLDQPDGRLAARSQANWSTAS